MAEAARLRYLLETLAFQRFGLCSAHKYYTPLRQLCKAEAEICH
jgi:hypothetical protein